MPVTRTSLPGGAVVAMVNRWRASRFAGAPRSSALRSTPGRHVDVSTVGSANTASSASAGWIDTSSTTVTPSRRIHPQVENTDMYMWSSTNTWSRSTDEPVEVLGPLLVGDRRDRRLEPGDVRLERDRDLVAEAALHARADRAQEPGGRRRHAERRSAAIRTRRRSPLEHAVAEQLEPEREQRVGQRGEQRRARRPRPAGRGSWR